ncbi:MAG: CoA transferase [Actinobacteria bacterium]|nr:CoA transferase [Actinomycetota bacterium]
MDGMREFGARAWGDLGGDRRLFDRVGVMEPPVTLSSRLDVMGLAGASVAVAVLAVHEMMLHRGIIPELPRFRISGDRLGTSIRSERSFRLDGERPNAWAPLSGFFRAADGWVRTHGNYPHHAERLRAVLGLSGEASPQSVAEAMAGLTAQEIEDRAAAAGAVAVRVRTPEEWRAHPQAAALAAEPLIARRPLCGGRVRIPDGGALPLAGIRVLDLTRVIAGPVASRDLAFAGADVLRVDSPRLPEIPWQHLDTGQGKRSTLLDLADRHDRARFEELLTSADAVMLGYRPGGLDTLGLSPEALAERRPGIVVGRVSAWGTTGPWASRRGFDSIVQAASGIAVIESDGDGDGDGAGEDDDRRPGALPAQALDHSAGHLLAAGVIRALIDARRAGDGAEVSVALARVAQELLAGGVSPQKTQDHGGAPTIQSGRTRGVPRGEPGGDVELITAAPVLSYPGAPNEYPEFGGAWGADPPSWR